MRTLPGWLAAVGLFFSLTANAAVTIYGSAYVGGGGASTLYSINPSTGAATVIGPIGFPQVGAMDLSPSGVLFGMSPGTLITINRTTGVGTAVGPTGLGSFQDLAFRSDGTLFGYSQGDIYTINTTTGAATLIGNTGGFPDGNAIAFNGPTLYLGNTNGGAQGSLQSVNTTTAAVTVVAPFSYGAGFTPANQDRPGGMKFDRTTGTLYAAVIEGSTHPATGRFLGIIDPTTGAVTDVGPTIAGLDAIALLSSPVGGVPTLSDELLLVLAALALCLGFSRLNAAPAA
ncbi:MAG: hypothetical protein WA190_05560 [Usitatibacter sp.]